MSEYLERLQKRLEELHPPEPEEVKHDPDLIPDVEESRIDDDLQPVLDNIDILDAYARWSGKPFTPSINGKRESIMIRCPNPAHYDENPSAWINLDKQTWYCGGCAFGDDKYGIAAFHFGHDVPGYKGKNFPELRKAMVEACGVTVYRNPVGKYQTVPIIEEPDPEVEVEPDPPAPLKLVVPTSDPEDPRIYLDWEPLVEAGTFLDHWMSAATEGNHLPHEFYWGEGLMALGLAVGNNVYVADDPNVYLNMMAIILGGQSQGKTRTIKKLSTLIQEAIPFELSTTTPSSGVKWFKDPASHQALKELFEQKFQMSPGVETFYPVRGCQYSYELEHIIQATKSRSGNSNFISVIEELFDETEGEVTSHSRDKAKAVKAYHPFYCNITTTQPDYIHQFLGKEHSFSGFLSRWLVYAGVRRVDPIAVPTPADLADSISSLKDIHLWATKQRVLQRTDEAHALWLQFFHDVLFPFTEQTDDPITGRFELYLKKFQGLFAVNEKSEWIEKSHVEKAIALWDYHLKTWRFFSGKIIADELDACMNKISQYIQTQYDRTGHGLSFRDLTKHARGKGTMFTIEQLTRAMAIMRQFDMIKPYETSQTTKFVLAGMKLPENPRSRQTPKKKTSS